MPITEYTDIAGCQLLLRDTVGVFSDAGTTPATEGSAVSQWNDQSGNANHIAWTNVTYSLNRPGGRIGSPMSAGVGTPATQIDVNRRSFTLLWVGSHKELLTTQNLFTSDDSTFVAALYLTKVLFSWQAGNNSSDEVPPTGQKFALVIRGSASAIKYWLNSSSISSTKGAAASGTVDAVKLRAPAGAGIFSEFVYWNTSLTDGEVDDALALAASRNSLSVTPTDRIAFEGDSLSNGVGDSLHRNWTTRISLPTSTWRYNRSTSGRTTTTAATESTTLDAMAWKNTGWLACWLGTNDINNGADAATAQTRVSDFLTARISAGWAKSRIIVFTINGNFSTGTLQGHRDDFNTWLRANYTDFATYLVDVAADPVIGVGVWSHFVDSLHMNGTGYARVAEIFQAAVTPLFPSGAVVGSGSLMSRKLRRLQLVG